MLTKAFTGEIKEFKEEGDLGMAKIIFATTEAVDKDKDWTVKGAFGSQVAAISGAHDWSGPSQGIAKISEVGNSAVADLQYNLKMDAAREWFNSLKFTHENGGTQSFSYGFDILEESPEVARENGALRALKKLKVHEVSPVMVPAGIGTGILAVKSLQELPIDTHLLHASEVLDAFVDRCKGLVAEYKEGRVLAAAMRNRLSLGADSGESAIAALQGIVADIRKILEDTDPEKSRHEADQRLKERRRLHAEFLLSEARLPGHIGALQ